MPNHRQDDAVMNIGIGMQILYFTFIERNAWTKMRMVTSVCKIEKYSLVFKTRSGHTSKPVAG